MTARGPGYYYDANEYWLARDAEVEPGKHDVAPEPQPSVLKPLEPKPTCSECGLKPVSRRGQELCFDCWWEQPADMNETCPDCYRPFRKCVCDLGRDW